MWSIMKPVVYAAVVLFASAHLAVSAPAETVTFYVQLVQGTDGDTPPAAGATLVGDALGHRLQMFRWKNYWEVKRQQVELTTGARIRQHLTRHRDVEIALANPNEMTVCIYTDGTLTRKEHSRPTLHFTSLAGTMTTRVRGSSSCAATNLKTPRRRKRNHRSAIHTNVPSGSLS